MSKIKKFDMYNETKSEITLTEDEKKYFWSKVEFNKKKRYTKSKNDIYETLTSDGDTVITSEDMVKFLNSLNYATKKQMKDPEKKFMNPNAESLKAKIPSSWAGVKFSSLDAKKKREEDKEEDK